MKDEGRKEQTIETANLTIKKEMDNETISESTELSIDDIDLMREVLK